MAIRSKKKNMFKEAALKEIKSNIVAMDKWVKEGDSTWILTYAKAIVSIAEAIRSTE